MEVWSVRAGDVRVGGEIRTEGFRTPAKLGLRRIGSVVYQKERGQVS